MTGLTAYAPLLAALIALLLGLAVGKAWERYKLKDGKWIDRRRARQSSHYILGLNFLGGNQIDLAIEELSRAAWRSARQRRGSVGRRPDALHRIGLRGPGSRTAGAAQSQTRDTR